MAICNIRNKATEDINYGRVTKRSLRLLPEALHEKAQIKMARLSATTCLEDLRELRGNRLETLSGDREGQYSIRINDQYRICFRWQDENIYDVEIVDYHK